MRVRPVTSVKSVLFHTPRSSSEVASVHVPSSFCTCSSQDMMGSLRLQSVGDRERGEGACSSTVLCYICVLMLILLLNFSFMGEITYVYLDTIFAFLWAHFLYFNTHLYCFVGCLSIIVWTRAVLGVL